MTSKDTRTSTDTRADTRTDAKGAANGAGAADSDGVTDTDGLRARIDRTRDELGTTIEELVAKADVKTRTQEAAAHAVESGRRNAKPIAAAGGALVAVTAAGLLARRRLGGKGHGAGRARALRRLDALNAPAVREHAEALGAAGKAAGKSAGKTARRTAQRAARETARSARRTADTAGSASRRASRTASKAAGKHGKRWYRGARHTVPFAKRHWYDSVPGSTALAYKAGKAVGAAKRGAKDAVHH
ncbi:DUF3618 domain-containing protein [Streptomyces sp. NPDC054796]